MQNKLSFFEAPPCGALQEHEVRHLVDLPPQGIAEGSSRKRSIIEDTRTRKTRVEVPRQRAVGGGFWRPVLHKVQDEGSIGLHAALWMDQAVSMRTTTTEDPWNRLHNDMKGSLVECGLWLCVLEHTIVYNGRAGPWSSHSFASQVKGAHDEYFRTRTPECTVFRLLYTDIVKEMQLPIMDIGSPEHLEMTFQAVKNLDFWGRRGEKVKLGRWQSWFGAVRNWQPVRSAYLLILPFMGLRRRWWSHVGGLPSVLRLDHAQGGDEAGQQEQSAQTAPATSSRPSASSSMASAASSAPSSPRGASNAGSSAQVGGVASSSTARPPLTVSSAGPSTTAREQPRTVRESNQEVSRLRNKATNNLHLAALVLSNTFGCQVVDAVAMVCQPLNKWFSKSRSECKTARGGAHWRSQLACGGIDSVLMATFEACFQPDVVALGLCAPDDALRLSDDVLSHEDQLMDIMKALAQSLVKNVLLSSFTWSHKLPGFFLSLLDCT